jgi:hypothetical protein
MEAYEYLGPTEETLLGAIFDVTNPMEVSAEGTPSSR